jgi:hypothetical protein
MEDFSVSMNNGGLLYLAMSRDAYTQASGAYVMTRYNGVSGTFTSATLLDGGGWTVRRFVPGNGKWHPATDQLVGTDVYGLAGSSIDAWSIEYKSIDFDQFMFNSGDGTKWMIMTRLEAIGTDAAPAWYDNEARTVFKSSINSN